MKKKIARPRRHHHSGALDPATPESGDHTAPAPAGRCFHPGIHRSTCVAAAARLNQRACPPATSAFVGGVRMCDCVATLVPGIVPEQPAGIAVARPRPHCFRRLLLLVDSTPPAAAAAADSPGTRPDPIDGVHRRSTSTVRVRPPAARGRLSPSESDDRRACPCRRLTDTTLRPPSHALWSDQVGMPGCRHDTTRYRSSVGPSVELCFFPASERTNERRPLVAGLLYGRAGRGPLLGGSIHGCQVSTSGRTGGQKSVLSARRGARIWHQNCPDHHA